MLLLPTKPNDNLSYCKNAEYWFFLWPFGENNLHKSIRFLVWSMSSWYLVLRLTDEKFMDASRAFGTLANLVTASKSDQLRQTFVYSWFSFAACDILGIQPIFGGKYVGLKTIKLIDDTIGSLSRSRRRHRRCWHCIRWKWHRMRKSI